MPLSEPCVHLQHLISLRLYQERAKEEQTLVGLCCCVCISENWPYYRFFNASVNCFWCPVLKKTLPVLTFPHLQSKFVKPVAEEISDS